MSTEPQKTKAELFALFSQWFNNHRWTKKESRQQAFLVMLLFPLLLYACWCGQKMLQYSKEQKQIKSDYAVVNGIRYGLLSVDRWSESISELATSQIDQFNLSVKQESALRETLDNILNSLITQVDDMFNEKQKSFGGKMKKLAFRTFVNVDKIRERIPEFSETILDELKDPQNKKKLKFVAKSKIDQLAKTTGDFDVDQFTYNQIMAKYEYQDQDEFNFALLRESSFLEGKTYYQMFNILGIMMIFLLAWVLIRKQKILYRPMYFMSVILAFIILYMGLVIPMIEIDARTERMSFQLMGKALHFYDQVIFFQSKSILDVVKILLGTHKIDSMFVGILILTFSVLFPITKLLSTEVYLFGSEKWKNNGVIKFFAFKSSKWSMADVMVVAIFMAYIGFNGILDNQLQSMNMQTRSIQSIATNHTSLQPGFILFIAFVLFGFILSEILKINFSDLGESAIRHVKKHVSKIRIKRK